MALNQKYNHNIHIALVAPAAVVSGQPVKIGGYTGVAQISAERGERVTIWLDGSYMVPVTGVVAQGDQINIDESGNLVLASDGGTPWGVANGEKADGDEAEVEVAPFGMVPVAPAVDA
ncbi:Head fiber protein [Glutamicibacter phage Montesquieu]|nr:Head fiber protein [Glutamicibacter phage Montesquieu]